jgi:hypothetical protein
MQTFDEFQGGVHRLPDACPIAAFLRNRFIFLDLDTQPLPDFLLVILARKERTTY